MCTRHVQISVSYESVFIRPYYAADIGPCRNKKEEILVLPLLKIS